MCREPLPAPFQRSLKRYAIGLAEHECRPRSLKERAAGWVARSSMSDWIRVAQEPSLPPGARCRAASQLTFR